MTSSAATAARRQHGHLSTLRRFYEQIQRVPHSPRLQDEVDGFRASLDHAEFLLHVYTSPVYAAPPPQLVQAVEEVERSFQSLRAAVAQERARLKRHGGRAAPLPRSRALNPEHVPPQAAEPEAAAAAAPAKPATVVPIAKAGTTVVVPAGPSMLRRIGHARDKLKR